MTRAIGSLLLAATLCVAPTLEAQPREEDGVVYFDVDAFRITGPNPLDESETETLLEPYLGEQAGFLGLASAAEVLEQAIRARGYTFHRVIVPPQRARGTIELQVLVFRIGDVVVEGNEHFDEPSVLAMLPSLVAGDTPNSRALTRDMQRANQHPAKNLTLTMRPSDLVDRVDALITVEDTRPHRLFANANNWGSKETGDERLAVGYQYSDFLGRDQVLTATYTTSPRELDNVRQYGLTWQIPLYDSSSSLTLLASYSDVDSGVVAEFFEVTGEGTVLGATFDHSFLARGRYRHGFRASITDKQFDNVVDFLGQNIGTDVRSSPASLAYYGGWVSERSSLTFDVGLHRNLPFGENNDNETYALSRAGADANWFALRASSAVDYRITGSWLLRTRWAAQLSPEPLIAGEQFGLGGERSVRGFEQRADVSDSGITAAVELWVPRPTETTNVLLFLDAGVGKRNEVQVGEEEHPNLLGTGIGLRWRPGPAFSASLDWAYVLEGTSEANDGDNRLHFNLTALF
ncbi:MAG: ShlB/FhaC/HecB family hemolysin secretion/activation protein [Pseudomonadales bacterium]|nr:ShlB/FhaC/HecB family hemolysin secretion/activation protein [Pseudomonadales bacterium]